MAFREVSVVQIKELLRLWLTLGMPVVVVQHVAPETSPIFAKGSHGHALHEVVTSRSYDHHVEKTLPSAFVGTDLAPWLEARSIDTIVIVGYI
jgi:nicotinamidase-related amidase